jgi:TldD protein
VGIRVLKGDQTGYSYTEDLSLKSMKLAAQTAAEIANDTRQIPPQKFSPGKKGDYYPLQKSWESAEIDNKIGFLEKVNEMIYQKDSRIIKATLSFYDESSYILIATSDGVLQTDYQPMTGFNVNCIAEQNNRRESNHYGLSVRDDILFFTPERLEELAHESVRYTVQLFDAVKPEPGEMEVVLAAGSSGILLHEAIGHGMEADFNRKNVSIFADKLGKRVANDFVSIVDDGTNPHLRGSINVDDEGNPVERTVLVENGILKSYLHDRISAKFYGVKPTGNGRRESFKSSPMPRMRNTYMLAGPHKKEEIIQSVRKGILAETFSNGQVFIGAGDFTFYVKSGYLIENGKITRPIKDVNLIGNGPKVLENIVMVADDPEMAKGSWTCGKNGQGVPVSQGLPTVKVSSITVGGVS